MRTQDEIVARYEVMKADDWLGTIAVDLLPFVDFDHVKPYIKPEVTEWVQQPLTDEIVRAALVEYLPFAWDKARGERGISASRSIQHMQSWLWLLGDDELLAYASDDANYPEYGRPILHRISEKYAPGVEF